QPATERVRVAGAEIEIGLEAEGHGVAQREIGGPWSLQRRRPGRQRGGGTTHQREQEQRRQRPHARPVCLSCHRQGLAVAGRKTDRVVFELYPSTAQVAPAVGDFRSAGSQSRPLKRRQDVGYLAKHPKVFRAAVVIGSMVAVALAAGDGKWG